MMYYEPIIEVKYGLRTKVKGSLYKGIEDEFDKDKHKGKYYFDDYTLRTRCRFHLNIYNLL